MIVFFILLLSYRVYSCLFRCVHARGNLIEVLDVHLLLFILEVLLEGVLLLLVLGVRFKGILLLMRLVLTPASPWVLLHCSALVGLDGWQAPPILPGIPPVVLDGYLERL